MALELPQLDLPHPTLDDFRNVLEREGAAIVDNEVDLGFLSFRWKNGLLAYVAVKPHEACLPLQYFDDTAFKERRSFDAAFESALTELCSTFGPAQGSSSFLYAHRHQCQHYLYSWWQLRNCRLVLAQDERDIQFGIDLSVRFVYASGPLEPLVYGENR